MNPTPPSPRMLPVTTSGGSRRRRVLVSGQPMTRSIRLTLLAAAAFIAPSASAADADIVKSLGNVIDLGAPMFNAGDQDGCFRLYQGSLIAVQPLLGHKPELQRRVQQQLDKARSLRTASERAFALRAA